MADLSSPSNIKTEAIYDPDLGMYVIHTRLGERDLVTPMLMSPEEYNNWENRRSMQSYFQSRNAMRTFEAEKEPFNILDMNFALGPLEKVFGPG